jgi:hypothetical protein
LSTSQAQHRANRVDLTGHKFVAIERREQSDRMGKAALLAAVDEGVVFR